MTFSFFLVPTWYRSTGYFDNTTAHYKQILHDGFSFMRLCVRYKILLEARGLLSESSEMAPVVTVFFMRDTEATEPRTGLARASSLLDLFIYTQKTLALSVKQLRIEFLIKYNT